MTTDTMEMLEPTVGDEGGKKRKKKQNTDGTKKIKPPTAEELNKLRETENLFLSNMFRLQIEEMLKEVKPKKPTLDKIKEWFDTFTKTLLQDMDTSDYKKVCILNSSDFVVNLFLFFATNGAFQMKLKHTYYK